MKEKPIIMSGNHPRLILEGIKTQTRRVIKPQPPVTLLNPTLVSKDSASPSGYSFISDEYGEIQLKCPYGQVGDRLWVKETWTQYGRFIIFKVDQTPIFLDRCKNVYKWCSPRFMPRKASQILLEIIEVRAERIQDISADDVKAEGCGWDYYKVWDSLNAKRGYGWSVNPWVWVISFKVVK